MQENINRISTSVRFQLQSTTSFTPTFWVGTVTLTIGFNQKRKLKNIKSESTYTIIIAIQKSKYNIQNPKLEIQNLELKIQNQKFKIQKIRLILYTVPRYGISSWRKHLKKGIGC